jgi:hypothetical protein
MDNSKKIYNKIKSLDLYIDDVPIEFWNNEEYIYQLLDINYEVFKFFSDEKKNSKDFVVQLIKKYECFRIYEFLPEILKEDKEILNLCIEHNLDNVHDKYKLDDTLIRNVLTKYPKSLCYFPDIVKNNIEYVRISIKKEGDSFIHASEELRSNIDLVYESTTLSEDPNDIIFEDIGEALKRNINDLKLLIDKYLKNHKENEYFIESLIKEIDESLKNDIVKYIENKKLFKNKIWDTKKISWVNDYSYEIEEPQGSSYTVKFLLESFYEDENENIKVEAEKEFHSSNLDELFNILEDEINNDTIDDAICLNHNSKSDLIYTNIDYIEIRDQENKIVYQSKN